MEYFNFAKYYDSLTSNVDYKNKAEYFNRLIEKYSKIPINHIVDLACGTASLSVELASFGYQITGVDISEQMLEQASQKTGNKEIILVLQNMEELSLISKADAVICGLDSINHLDSITALEKTFRQVFKNLNKGGVFIFDVNTLYKHKYLLANNCYTYETDDVFCCWQNSFNNQDYSVDIYLDFFVNIIDDNYKREFEDFREMFFSSTQIKNALEKSGLELLAILGENSLEKPRAKEERIFYVARLS